MTMTEKLYLMESMERRNKEAAARQKPYAANATWRKCSKYGNTYEVRLDDEAFEEARKRGCTHVSMIGWSVNDALKKLNERIAFVNMQVVSVDKSILSC